MQFLLSGQDLEHKRIFPTFWSYKNLYKKAFTAFRRLRWEFIKEIFQEKKIEKKMFRSRKKGRFNKIIKNIFDKV